MLTIYITGVDLAPFWFYNGRYMELIIDTTDNNLIRLALKKGSEDKNIAGEWPARYDQAEILLPRLEKFLQANNLGLDNITAIAVNNNGGSFSALRIGVVTANALGYALGVPVKEIGQAHPEKKKHTKTINFSVVQPKYGMEPNITKKRLK